MNLQTVFCSSSICLASVMLSLAGCGSSDDDQRTQQQEPEVDPRFATAEAILAYFNSLNTQLPPNLPEIAPLYYAENDFQRRQLQFVQLQANERGYRLEKAMYDRFGEPILDYAKFNMPPPKKCAVARIERILDRRVESSFKNGHGKQIPLQLVQIGNRWWVSGYSLEFQIPEEDREMAKEFVGDFHPMNDPVDLGFLDQVIADIRAGKYESAAAARHAYMDAMKEHFKWDRPRQP